MEKEKVIEEELIDKKDFNDLPIETPEEDLFSYKDFAKNVADIILKLEKPKGTVIGIQGEWGSGKSSILNMIEFYLEQQNHKRKSCIKFLFNNRIMYPKKDIKTVIVKIDPWWFSNNQNLTERFLIEVAKGLGSADYTEIRKCLVKLCDSLSIAFKVVPLAQGGLKGLSYVFEHSKPLYEQKLNLSQKLDKLKEKIVIFIDDIDRLETLELKSLLKAVKAVGNLPNVIYLLAYDPEIVFNILGQNNEYGCDGQTYLEKIVQIPLDIPTPEPSGFLRYTDTICSRQFGSELATNQNATKNLSTLYHYLIKTLIRTPRKLIRYFNEVSLVYSMVREDVNFIDLLGLILVKTKNYGLYKTIKENSKFFVDDFEITVDLKGSKETDIFAREFNIIKESYTNDDKLILYLLFALFPKFKGRISNNEIQKVNPYFSFIKTDPLKKGKHIDTNEFFHNYFRMSLFSDSVSMKTVNQILSTTNHYEIEKIFSGFSSPTIENFDKMYNLVDLLVSNKEHIKPFTGEQIIRCLFNIEEDIFNFKKNKVLSSYYLEDICNYLIIFIFENILSNEKEKLQLLNDVFIHGISINLKMKLTGGLFKYKGFYKDVAERKEDYIIKDETLNTLKTTIISSIQVFLNDINNIKRINFVFNIFHLYKFLDFDQYSTWIRVFDDDKHLLELINIYFSRIPEENGKLDRFYLSDYVQAFNSYINLFDNVKRLENIRDDKKVSLEKKYISDLTNYIKTLQDNNPTSPPPPPTA